MNKISKKGLLVSCLLSSILLSACSTPMQSRSVDKEVEIYLVRHGKTMLNTTDRVQGWSDAVLTPEGEEVVNTVAVGLQDVPFVGAFSSDSGRSVQTAELILAKNQTSNQLVVQKDWRMREFNFGTYEGDLNHNMWSDIAKHQGMTFDEWFNSDVSPREFADSVAALEKVKMAKEKNPPSNWPAEDYATITKRLRAGIEEIAKQSADQGGGPILVVSHGLSIGALVDNLKGGYQLPAGGIKNASVTKIHYKNGQFEVKEIGDVSYLEKGKAILGQETK
ncbi:histidine phosphatase family protein [Thorsellia kenyensis]|uniref:Histidine phosphatase family protein n=1 Tax=Thorsellia kenyensis TaxID=1549888 RepID=A0ABV6C9R4_9GAMM